MSTTVEADMKPNEKVLEGLDSFLFLQNDTNLVLDQITGRLRCSDNLLFSIAAAHNARAEFGHRISNFDYHHILIPNKEVVLSSLLPQHVSLESQGPRPYSQYELIGASALSAPFYISGWQELLDGSSMIFPRQDTHWTHKGAIAYLKAFLDDRLPVTAKALSDIQFREFEAEQIGDLGLKCRLGPEKIIIKTPLLPSSKQVFNNGIVNEGNLKHYSKDCSRNGSKLLVLHDSFTNWLEPTIAELFDEVIFHHTADFDFGFAKKFAPDQIWFIQVERFFIRPPVNGVDWSKQISVHEEKKGCRTKISDSHLASFFL